MRAGIWCVAGTVLVAALSTNLEGAINFTIGPHSNLTALSVDTSAARGVITGGNLIGGTTVASADGGSISSIAYTLVEDENHATFRFVHQQTVGAGEFVFPGVFPSAASSGTLQFKLAESVSYQIAGQYISDRADSQFRYILGGVLRLLPGNVGIGGEFDNALGDPTLSIDGIADGLNAELFGPRTGILGPGSYEFRADAAIVGAFTEDTSGFGFTQLALTRLPAQNAVPEPSTFALFGLGSFGLAFWARRRGKRTSSDRTRPSPYGRRRAHRSLLAERLEDRCLMAVDFAWAQTLGTSEFSESGRSVAVDNAGGLYVLYKAADSSGVLKSNVTKYDANTRAVVWTQVLEGEARRGSIAYGGKLIVASGSVFIAEEYNGDNGDIFLASLNAASGAIQWTREYSGGPNRWESGRAVAFGPDGLYVAGHFSGSIDLGGVLLTGVPYEYPDYVTDGYLAKLDPATGETLAAVTLGHVSDQMMGLVAQGSSLYFAGGSVVAEYDTDLNLVRRSDWSGVISAKDIAVDLQGNVLVTGFLRGTADLDPSAGTAWYTSAAAQGDRWHPVSGPSTDSFVLKLNPAGSLLWARTFGGGGADFPFAMTVDSLGNVYTTGSFQQKVDFDPGPGQFTLTSQPTSIYGTNDAYISILNSGGSFVWAGALTGGSNLIDGDSGIGIAVDDAFNIYVTGVFTDSADLNPGKSKFIVKSRGGMDPFLLKLTQSGLNGSAQTAPSQQTLDTDASLLALEKTHPKSKRRSFSDAGSVAGDLDGASAPGIVDDDLLTLLATG